ncbi:glycerophosphodiester phosphodiesterase [uncultured Ramlibacter sp.]|uniref:glycerophosphodiester phosphodiesterase n=1 Tax=uncultured Ramlibacter sp. TaxID=260755 RepID=UPI0026158E3A|nr:glycerophosphodiester phosphodiesterase [uncultured Ramlibacter sp.]
MNILRLSCAALGLLAATTCLAFDLQAHRGARGLAPENTLPAFERALEVGVDTLELDVGLTADGVVVISHDPYLNPLIVRDAAGQWLEGTRGPLLKALTYTQLQAYELGRIKPGTPYATTFATQQPRDGTRMPTLAALFARVKALGADKLRFNIETKIDPTRPDDTVSPEAMVQALLKVVRDAGMDSRVTIQSFDWRSLQIAQKLAPAVPTAYLSFQNANNDTIGSGQWTAGFKIAEHASLPAMVKAAGGAIWSPNGGAVTQELVKQAQAMGLKVLPWTINNPPEMDKLIGWGVDGIITDYPDRLRSVMQARGMALPAPVARP